MIRMSKVCVPHFSQLNHRTVFSKGVTAPPVLFCYSSIDTQLRNATEELGKDPISLDPPGRVNRSVLHRAKEMLETEVDGGRTIQNYFAIKPTFRLKGNVPIGVEGYVFNQSLLLWQADKRYQCKPEHCRQFLNSHIHGSLPRGASWDEAKKISLQKHFVVKSHEGIYECDCAAFWHSGGECSHSQAAMDLDGVTSIDQELQLIMHAKRSGRKSAPAPLDYAAHSPALASHMSEAQACNRIGTTIARRISTANPDRIYVGRVSGEYEYIGCHVINVCVIMCM